MKYFMPTLLKDGQEVLPFQISTYKYNFLWPLEQEASKLEQTLHYFTAILSLIAYIFTLVGEFTFVKENFDDIPALSECLTTTCMGVQFSIRIALWIKRQRKIRKLFQRFYNEIYFTDMDTLEFRKKVRNIMRVPDFFTKVYYAPMTLIYMKFLWDIFNTSMSDLNKPYIYRMSFRWYDAQRPLAYIITSFYTGWLTFSTVSLMSAEDFTICLMLCHTSYRIKELQKHLQGILEEARFESRRNAALNNNVHFIFRKKLYAVFRKQQKLYSFIDDAKLHFTYQIFFCLSFGVALLCVVAFQFQKTTIGLGWVKYIIWLISQISQFLMIGYFGQMLMDATSDMQQSYYLCKWEQLLSNGNAHANKLLMGDIRFAIMNAQSPVVFHGLKFVPLTHSTVGAALRSALSYFMFLNTMNDANKSK